MPRIPLSEVAFHPMSVADRNGRLFVWRDEIYRGIPPEQSAFYANLFEIGLVEDLVDRGLLVPTWPTEFKLDNFGLIVKHKRFPFVSYPFEWSREMLKQSALNLIDLEIALSQHNLGLQDPNPWKVLFDGPRPVFVDFGSIVPEGVPALWEANGEFFRFIFDCRFQNRIRGCCDPQLFLDLAATKCS